MFLTLLQGAHGPLKEGYKHFIEGPAALHVERYITLCVGAYGPTKLVFNTNIKLSVGPAAPHKGSKIY